MSHNDRGRKNTTSAAQIVHDIGRRVADQGGDAYLVGGAVISELSGRVPDNYDLELHGLEQTTVETILGDVAGHEPLRMEGRSYGVYRLTVEGIDIECSLPRRDSKTGPRHPDVTASIDPFMGVAAAAQRRDFTIGAIYKHVLTGQIEDPTGGRRDLAEHVLRAVDDRTFADDPLRAVRAVQLAGRYDLQPDLRTLALLRSLVPETVHLPPERFAPEWRKLFLKSEHPSIGLRLAKTMGLYRIWSPELDALDHIEQDPEYHPEGDVWTHTLLVVDEAKTRSPQELEVHLAALLHDTGKSTTTRTDERGRIIAYGHEQAGCEPAQRFLERQGFGADSVSVVTALIREHMTPHTLYREKDMVHDGAIRRLARRLSPATIDQLCVLASADIAGSSLPGGSRFDFPSGDWLRDRARALKIEHQAPIPIIHGRDLLARGWKPGPIFGQIITAAELAIENGRTETEIKDIIADSPDPDFALSAIQKE